jgi:CRISPR/Cas system-associated protein Cas7 (RAMP superfamily)
MESQAEANVLFVSAASWRRWLRDTLIEETGLKPSTIRARGNTDKIGSERNPIEYIEDDLFGYSVSLYIPNELC